MISGLPQGKRSAVWKAIVQVLQADPILRRLVKTWQVWAGTSNDDDPPCEGGLPWVRLTPAPPPSRWATISTTEAPIALLIEIWIPGTSAADLMDFWECFERALYPGDGTVLRKLRAAAPGAHCGLNLEQPGFGAEQLGEDLALHGAGHLIIPYRTTTIQ